MFCYNLCLEASAGSGKTFALSIRYVSLLFLGAKPSSILTLTFTNKASNEMRERIVNLLKNLESKEAELNEIIKLTNLKKEQILQKRKKIYKNFLNSTLLISTIDKFNTQILRSFSLYLSLMPDFSLKEGVDEEEFLKEFLSKIKKKNLYKNLLEFCVYEQKRVQEVFAFLNILNQKRDDLKHIKISSYDISKSKKRVLKEFLALKEFFFSCQSLSSSAKKALELEDIEEILHTTWITKNSLEEYRYFKKCFSSRADEIFFDLKDALKEYLRAKEAYYKEHYLKIFDVYKDVKKRLNLKTNTLEFDDITNFVYELLVEKKLENSFLYFRLDSKIEHILIDEFQDTSISQYRILEPLIEEVVAGEGVKGKRSFFYVGDTKQSIYRFRGGVKELFSYVQKRFNVKKEYLDKNYRSYKKLVLFVNSVFKDKIKNYIPQIPQKSEDKGYIEVCQSDELLELITQKVGFLLDNKIDPDEIAILTFSNKDSFIIEEELNKNFPTIPTTTTTTDLLINSKSVKTVLEFLKYFYFKEQLFLENFKALLAKDIEVDLNHFNISKPLPLLIRDVVKYFKLYDSDEDIIKLIEISKDYKDIEQFLFESKNIDTTSAKTKQSGIKLLTIHKSKGLEFSHVILADRLSAKSPNKDSMIFYYDDITLKDMYIKLKNREFLDKKYQKALKADKKLQIEDELNTLYVALTRAKKSLIITQKETNSSFSLLNLSPFCEGFLDTTKESKKKIIYEDFSYESISVGAQEKQKNTLDDLDLKAVNFGIAMHYMLENLENFTFDEIENAFWSMKNRFFQKLDEEDFKDIKKRVENLLNNKKFQTLIDGKRYKEISLAYEGELKQLDLVVEKKEKVIIIDYKSSKKEQKKHINQVVGYKRALKEITKKETLSYLCYLNKDDIEIICV